MKKIVSLIVLSFLAIVSINAQESSTGYFTAYYTAMFEYNTANKKWDKVFENEDVSISIGIKSNIVSIQAQNQVTIQLDRSSMEELDYPDYKVTRWEGYELTAQRNLTFDLVYYKNSRSMMIAIRYNDSYPRRSLHYYIK